MLDKIQEKIYDFRNKKGVDPNALILGIAVIEELKGLCDIIISVSDEVKYVCGLPVLCIDYSDINIIKPVLIWNVNLMPEMAATIENEL